MLKKRMYVKAVLFDFDGTLTKPEALDFPKMKKAVGCPPHMAILEYIETLPNPKQQEKAHSILQQLETEAAAKSAPGKGAEAAVLQLREMGFPTGLITRNSLASVKRALENFNQIGMDDFDVVITRDEPIKPKPSPDGVLLAAKRLNVHPSDTVMVGDYLFDIQAGSAAGAKTVFLDNHSPHEDTSARSDHTISCLSELPALLVKERELKCGKLPNSILNDFLDRFCSPDAALLTPPGVGQDTAAVDLGAKDLIVLKSDPITFVTEAIGAYAVLINANDIATAGAAPRWLLTTLLFPPGTRLSEVEQVMSDLKRVCDQCGITLCGGHTEITDAVVRPVISAMLVGVVAKDGLIDKRHVQKGDQVLLTKQVAVEGTAIIAREFADRLERLGMEKADIKYCQSFLDHISILKEAELAGGPPEISAMHDITEGGLATAAEELSTAAVHRIRIHMDQIPVFPQTKDICRMLDLDPLGLIGSGSLLICCKKEQCQAIMQRINAQGIRVTRIGEVLDPGDGIEAIYDGATVCWPRFETDELTRLFGS